MIQRSGIGLLVAVLASVPSWTWAQTPPRADPPPPPATPKVEPDDEEAALSRSAGQFLKEGKYGEAEKALRSALAIRERADGPDTPETARCLCNLAVVVMKQGKSEQAEALFKRALAIYEHAFGPEHLKVAKAHHDLGMLYILKGEYKQGMEHMERALAIRKKLLGPDDPEVGQVLNDLGALCHGLARSRGEYREPGKPGQGTRFADLAERYFQQALAIREKALGPDHPDVADSLNTLAAAYAAQKRYDEAESLMKRALAIREKALGPDAPEVAETIDQMVPLMKRAHFNLATIEEAWSLRHRARSIRAKHRQ